MSWGGGGAAGAGSGAPPGPLYAQPPQAIMGQQQYPNYQNGTTTNQSQAPQQQYWPNQPTQPPTNYNHQYGQPGYQQPEYAANNANQYYQYNQTYTDQGYNAVQPNYQSNFPNTQYNQNQVPQQSFAPTQAKDNWNDSWDWGWDEKSAQQKQQQPIQSQQPQQQNFNANVIEDSFGASDSWNWTAEDMSQRSNPAGTVAPHSVQKAPTPEPIVTEKSYLENNLVNEAVSNVPRRLSSSDNVNMNIHSPSLPHPPAVEEPIVRSLNDREVVKERIPNLALGKRFNLETLTPQWSIESQMSQESSDGPLTHSESTYKSDNQSRNSSKGSPGLNTDNANFNYSHSGLDNISPQNLEWNQQTDEVHTSDNNFGVVPPEEHRIEASQDDLANSLKSINIANRENPAPDNATQDSEQKSPNRQEMPLLQPLVTVPLTNLNPDPPVSAGMPPSIGSFPPASLSQNPFKKAGPISHKNSVKPPGVLTPTPSQHSLPSTVQRDNGISQIAPNNLASPSAVNKIAQQNSRSPVGYPTANLETTPDNSERPDQPTMNSFNRPTSVSQHMPVENLEVAPKNDRNQYLQTAHLSSGDYGENSSFGHNVLPPGLRRMVVGQHESEYVQNPNSYEPPPGLSRMVPGQQTDSDNSYNQPSDDYRERHIDGQTTEGNLSNLRNPFRQADGQQTSDTYSQNSNMRNTERRPFGIDRMVPGELSNDFIRSPQFSNPSYVSGSEHRVVTGVDHDYVSGAPDPSASEPREQNMDGSDYSEPVRNSTRNVIGATDALNVDLNVGDYNDTQGQSSPSQAEQQREVLMEGENLQDLSVISSVELSFRDQRMDGADVHTAEVPADRKTDASDSDLHGANSRTQSLIRGNTSGDDSDRDRAFKSSPRRDRDKRKTSNEHDSRYGREDKKVERNPERKSGREKDERRDKESRRSDRDSERVDAYRGEDRRYRRSTRDRRYDTEDTDYYSDRERERRRYREGSYTSSSKPPRPDDKERRYRDERGRRYATIERDGRRHDGSERDSTAGGRRGDRERNKDRRHEDKEPEYRDIDPKKYGSLRRERDERKRGEAYSSPSRPDSRDPDPTEDELHETPGPGPGERRDRRPDRSDRHRRQRRSDRHYDPYYDRYGGAASYSDPYVLQRQQQETFQYYERLRLTNPAAYMEVYKKVMAGQPLPQPPIPAGAAYEGYSSLGYEPGAMVGRDERGSVHSGRSSANGLGKDTSRDYETARDYYGYRPLESTYRRPAESVRTDLSGSRDFNTDASLGLHLEESTVRSERMTPFKFSTAHVKGNVSSRNLVMIHPSYPIDGLPATVEILSLSATLADDPVRNELAAYPGPLIKGVTHKKTVMEYCEAQVQARGVGAGAAPEGGDQRGGDLPGFVLLWHLLILLLRQNGMVVGTDIAELLVKNKREYEYSRAAKPQPLSNSRRNSAMSSGTSRSDVLPEDGAPSPAGDSQHDAAPSVPDEEVSAADASLDRRPSARRRTSRDAERLALDRYREYLLFGDRKEALEWAMCNNLWGHALQLASTLADRRLRAAVAARFVAAQPPDDALHTLYTTMAGRQPPAATCVTDEKWGDWRPHLAMILSNTSSRPEVDKRAITQLGDSLASRGLLHASQFCYLMARLEFARHPLAPLPAGARAASAPRLALLGAPPHVHTLAQLATNRAIFMTEIYEYACGLNDDNITMHEFQVYKWLLATRLVDCGMYERALAYVEQLARSVSAEPQAYSPHLLRNICEMAERLKYHDPALPEELGLLDEELDGELEGSSPRHQRQWLDDLKNLMIAAPAPEQPQPQQDGQPGYEQQQQQYSQQQYAWAQQQAADHAQQQYPQPPNPELTDTTVHRTAEESAHEYPSAAYYAPPPEPPGPPYAHDYYGRPPPADGQETAGEGDRETAAYGRPVDGGYWNRDGNQPSYGYVEPPEATPEPPAEAPGEAGAARQQISMPNSTASRSALFADYDDDRPAGEHDNATGQDKKAEKSGMGAPGGGGAGGGGAKRPAGAGWFGGIFNKLSLKPKNQMILPDDKNPTIVWDPERKRWTNLDGEEEEREGAPPPPPKMADLAALSNRSSPLPAAPPGSLPPAPGNTSNIFKMQKGRYIKKSYVDVFNPSGAPSRPLPPAAELLGPPAPAPAPPGDYFVPSPDQHAPMYEPSQYGNSEPQYQ